MFKIGKSAQENTLLVSSSRPKDVWFHVKDAPSAHLLYLNDNEDDLKTLKSNGTIYKMALQLKVSSAKFKKMQNVNVNYCFVDNVQVTETPGLVILSKKPSIITV